MRKIQISILSIILLLAVFPQILFAQGLKDAFGGEGSPLKTVKEKAGEKVCGNRIFCEHSKPMDEKPTEGAHGCIMKGKYALATVSKEPKRAGAIYKTTERIIPKTKWEALRKDMH